MHTHSHEKECKLLQQTSSTPILIHKKKEERKKKIYNSDLPPRSPIPIHKKCTTDSSVLHAPQLSPIHKKIHTLLRRPPFTALTVHVQRDRGRDGRRVVEVGGTTLEDGVQVVPREPWHNEGRVDDPGRRAGLLGRPDLVVDQPLHDRRGATWGWGEGRGRLGGFVGERGKRDGSDNWGCLAWYEEDCDELVF